MTSLKSETKPLLSMSRYRVLTLTSYAMGFSANGCFSDMPRSPNIILELTNQL